MTVSVRPPSDGTTLARMLWDQGAPAYLDFCHHWPRYRTLATAGARLLGLRGGERVIDVGCGVGDSALVLRAAVGSTGHVLALDLSPVALALARDRLGNRSLWFVAGDASAIGDTLRGRFDAILCNASIWQIGDARRFLRGCASLLRRGGPLVFNFPGFLPRARAGPRPASQFARIVETELAAAGISDVDDAIVGDAWFSLENAVSYAQEAGLAAGCQVGLSLREPVECSTAFMSLPGVGPVLGRLDPRVRDAVADRILRCAKRAGLHEVRRRWLFVTLTRIHDGADVEPDP